MRPFQEKIIKDKVQTHTSPVESEEIWASVRNELNARRRRRFIILFFWLSPMALIFGLIFFQKSIAFHNEKMSPSAILPSGSETITKPSNISKTNNTGYNTFSETIPNKSYEQETNPIAQKENVLDSVNNSKSISNSLASSSTKESFNRGFTSLKKLSAVLISPESHQRTFVINRNPSMDPIDQKLDLIHTKKTSSGLPIIKTISSLKALEISLGLNAGIGFVPDHNNTKALILGVKSRFSHKSGWFLDIGIDKIKMEDQFDYQGKFVQWDSTLGNRSIYIQTNGDTLIDQANIPVRKSLLLNLRSNNRTQLLEIPISIGRQFNNNYFTYGISTGIRLGIREKFSGTLINNEGVPYFTEKKSSNLNIGYQWNAFGEYRVSPKWALNAQIQQIFYPNSSNFNQLINLRLGINLKL